MLRPMTASTSTSTTDSPPPQSPITPPQYEHQLPPFFKDVQIMDFEPRMGALISSSSSSPPTLARRPYCKHDSLSSKSDFDGLPSLPSPPSGHDLMHFFPPTRPPHPSGLTHCIRPETSNSHTTEHRSNYTNTSAYFSKEEREFFRFGGSVTGRDLERRLEKERERSLPNGKGNDVPKNTLGPERIVTSRIHSRNAVETPPMKRRKSVDSGKSDHDSRQMSYSPPPPQLALGSVRQRVHPTASQHPPQVISSRSPVNSPSFNVQPEICYTQPTQPSAANPGPRRRAGKYTKRVFVHSNPVPNVNPPYLLANVYPPRTDTMNPTINVYPLANPLPHKLSVPYPPNPPSHAAFPQSSQFIEFAR